MEEKIKKGTGFKFLIAGLWLIGTGYWVLVDGPWEPG